MRAAASRTFWTAGSSRPRSTAMMAMTTSSSISVNARRRPCGAPVRHMTDSFRKRTTRRGLRTTLLRGSVVADDLPVRPHGQQGQDAGAGRVLQRDHPAVAHDELAHPGVAAAEGAVVDHLGVPDRVGAVELQHVDL